MHDAAYRYVERAVAGLASPPATVVEIGSYIVNGTIRPLFAGAAYVGLDLLAGPGVDVVADGATWRPPAPVACVVTCEALEHAPDARGVVANAAAMLAPGGALIVTAAGMGRAPHSVDGGPLRAGEHYRNILASELLAWLTAAGLTAAVEFNPVACDVYATAVKEGA